MTLPGLGQSRSNPDPGWERQDPAEAAQHIEAPARPLPYNCPTPGHGTTLWVGAAFCHSSRHFPHKTVLTSGLEYKVPT